MAKKVMPKSETPAPVTDAPSASAAMKATKPRATPVAAAKQPTVVTNEMIAERAYHKWKNGESGDQHEHWVRSERELRGNG